MIALTKSSVLLQTVLLACVFSNTLTGAQTLDTDTQSDRKLNYAVVPLKAAEGITDGGAEVITDRLRTELFKTGVVNIMERDQMRTILQEQGFQQSGACTDEACMVEMGQLLGVERLVSGSIGKLGSIYMVNIRVIDVRTGKIEKVVSADEQGQIERLVSRLPKIAGQVAGTIDITASEAVLPVSDEMNPSPVSKPTPDTLEVAESVQPALTQAGTTVDSATNEVDEDDVDEDEKKEETKGRTAWRRNPRNANFPGVRFAYFLTSSDALTHSFTSSGENFLGSAESYDYPPVFNDGRIASSTPIINMQVKFIVRVGHFVTVDVGPGFFLVNQEINEKNSSMSANDLSKTMNFRMIMPSVCTGANFVARLFPVKFTIGPVFDVNIPIAVWSYEREYVSSYGYTDSETDSGGDVNLIATFGFRVGSEILIGTHFGFGAELLYRTFDYTHTYENNDYYIENNSFESLEHQVYLPPLVLGLSVNFYW